MSSPERTARGAETIALCYHAVSESWSARISVSPDSLERQLSRLLDRGFIGVTFHDAIASPPAPRTLAVTFDDAYRSVIRLAWPILRKLGIRATVFVPTAFPGAERPMSWPGIEAWAKGPYAQELIPMSWDELGQLRDDGWEIGSHTRTHPRLSELDRESLLEQLERSRADCEARLGTPCRSLAYPYGEYNAAVVEAAARAGYSAAGTLARHVQRPTPLAWPRVGIYHGDGDRRFEVKVSSTMRRLRASRAWRARLLLRGRGGEIADRS
jgi:peptidoglycan/xylan/chitin deacetylase (PgdA/CDA1 family)